jgi:hypothetical protein|tara:strand:+ start:149 stop:289 length:141 start_codon:yes stop_codon:yes gene_type:complete
MGALPLKNVLSAKATVTMMKIVPTVSFVSRELIRMIECLDVEQQDM